MAVIRLDKYLADMQAGTRSQVKDIVRKGRVSVNGQQVREPDIKINPDTDVVTLDNRQLGYTRYEYFMLNKPAGVLSAANDSRAVTVVDLIKEHSRKDLFPVGRLDKDTEGLMLITNDGELSHRLLSPKNHTDKTYYVKVDGKLTGDTVRTFAEGLDINIAKCDDTQLNMYPAQMYHTLPAKLSILTSDDISEALVTLHEGKFHQIKRMFIAAGMRVMYLKRVSMGPLQLDCDLRAGEYRMLTQLEIEGLKKMNNTGINSMISQTAPIQQSKISLDNMLSGMKGVIFDMDGTLLDSMNIWKEIDTEFLSKRNLEVPPELAREIEGMSLPETAIYFKERFNLTESLDEIHSIWHEAAYDKYVHEIQLKPGARQLLDTLKSRGFKLGIATSNSRQLAVACLKSLGIKNMFDSIVTGDDVSHGKPDPEIYLMAAEGMNLFANSCLIFEDVLMGIQAGISAGMRTCAVYDDFTHMYDEEKRKMADYYINSFTDLL